MIPEILCTSYSKILVELSEKLTEKSLCKRLRMAKSAVEIWQIFEYTDSHSEFIEQPPA